MAKLTDLKEMVYNMSIGDESAIYNGLNHNGAVIRMNGIMFAANFKFKKSSIIDAIKKLTEDNTEFNGYTVSQFAFAALDVIGIEKYQGNDENIKELIDYKFVF